MATPKNNNLKCYQVKCDKKEFRVNFVINCYNVEMRFFLLYTKLVLYKISAPKYGLYSSVQLRTIWGIGYQSARTYKCILLMIQVIKEKNTNTE